jgi:hypothetical protein
MSDKLLAKRKREEEKAKKESMDKGISNYFTKGPVVAQPKAKVCQPLHFTTALLNTTIACQDKSRRRLPSRSSRRS